MTILEAQIEVAVELGRNISMHSVKSQQATLELLYQIRRSQVTLSKKGTQAKVRE